MPVTILMIIFIIMTFTGSTFAACSGVYPTTIRACDAVTSTAHIAGGNFSSPYLLSVANREYILDGDVSADSTAFVVGAAGIVLNLNGHTVTYNQVSPGAGVISNDYNRSNIAITNGSIIQGAAMSAVASEYGVTNNPIRFFAGTPQSYNAYPVQITDIHAVYGGFDTSGFVVGGSGTESTPNIVENCTLEDTYEYGTLTNRHAGITAIRMTGAFAIVRGNTIINVRQKGIEMGDDSEVYDNTIGIRSVSTNSAGISAGAARQKVHHNTITGRGEHPIGIAGGNDVIGVSHDSEIYNNTIDTQVTRIGLEYFGAYPSDALTATHEADNAVGIRCTTGTTNMFIHDNTIVVHSDSDYMGTYSPDGRPIRINAGARGFMVGLRANGQSMRIFNNTVTSLDKDGTGYAAGLACDANIDNANEPSPYYRPPAPDFAPSFIANNNTITSNIYNLVFGDAYQSCNGNALFVQNTLIKSGTYAAYATYASGLGGYYGNKVRVIGSVYQSGAAENSLAMYWANITNLVEGSGGSYRGKSIIFGDLQADGYLYYRYRLHNSEGTTGSTTPINETLNTVGPYYYSVYGPVTTPSKPSGNYKASQSVSLSTNGTSTTYCKSTSANCTPSTSYTTAVKVLTNIPYEKLCYQSTDGTNTETTVCKDYYKRVWR